jgi:histidine ammonia-lyase
VSIYDEIDPFAAMADEETIEHEIQDVRDVNGLEITYRLTFKITALKQRAMHSGRRLYRIYCLRCGAEVHGGTTGPIDWMENHLVRVHS